MKLDKSSLELVLNPATGSAFYVLGKTSELFCGFRLWFETRDGGAHQTSLRFRFRVGLLPGVSAPPVMIDYLTSIFPETKWSKVASKYGSLLGSVDTYAPISATAHVRNALSVNEAPEKIFNYMLESLRPMNFDFSQEEFVAFLWSLIDEELGGWEKALAAANAQVITFVVPSGGVSYSGGFCISPADVASPTIHNAGLTPVVAAPKVVNDAPQNPTTAASALKVTTPVGGSGASPVKPPTAPEEDIPSL